MIWVWKMGWREWVIAVILTVKVPNIQKYVCLKVLRLIFLKYKPKYCTKWLMAEWYIYNAF